MDYDLAVFWLYLPVRSFLGCAGVGRNVKKGVFGEWSLRDIERKGEGFLALLDYLQVVNGKMN